MKKLLLISAVFLVHTVAFGQKQVNIWYFGDGAGVDFNSGHPVALSDGQIAFSTDKNHMEGTSVISDSSGAVLFYSDGMTVWNKNHQVMQKGTGLLGNFSSTQSSIIVPDPANSNRYYYIFTVSSGFCCGGDISDGLRYSKVDICLDSSRGGVIPLEKNIKLVDTVTEKIAVTRHSNGIDYWVLTHRFYSNEFWALRLTATGISDTVITAIGSSHSGNIFGTQGQLKFSGSGEKIAIGASNGLDLLEMFDFDKTTGIVSNYQPLDIINNGSVYGVEFSSDGSKLYAVSSTFTPFSMDIGQYDLSAGNLAAINASLISVYHQSVSVTGRGFQMGPDGKIYMVSILNSGSLAVINNPNVYGTGCNFQDQAISLGGKQGSYSLPDFISGFDYSSGLVQCGPSGVSENALNEYLSIYPNPFSSSTTLQVQKPLYNAILKIYDAKGRAIRQVQNLSGQTVILQRDNLPDGLYFLQFLQDDKIIATHKLIISE